MVWNWKKTQTIPYFKHADPYCIISMYIEYSNNNKKENPSSYCILFFLKLKLKRKMRSGMWGGGETAEEIPPLRHFGGPSRLRRRAQGRR